MEQITITFLVRMLSVEQMTVEFFKNSSRIPEESYAIWFSSSRIRIPIIIKSEFFKNYLSKRQLKNLFHYNSKIIKVESFYDTETSIITSNIHQINLSNENIKYKHWCFQISKIVSQQNHFGILIYILSWKHLFEIYFRLLRRNIKLKINNFLTNIWCDDWHFGNWRRKRTPLNSL